MTAEAREFADLPSQEQARQRCVLLQALNLAYTHILPVLLLRRLPDGTVEMRNGTGSVVRCWGSAWLLTAYHVLAKYLEWKRGPGRIRMQVGENFLAPCECRRWDDPDADITLIELPAGALSSSRIWPHTPVEWPPAQPQAGTYVLASGFPKPWRELIGPGTVRCGAMSVRLHVTVVQETYIMCQWDREQMVDLGPDESPKPGADLGGMSGSPVFLERSLDYPLVGIITDWHGEFELMRIATLHHVPATLASG